MPSNAKLIFWDYYHTNPNIYSQKLQQHRDMGCQDPWIASKFIYRYCIVIIIWIINILLLASVWTWSRFWAALPFSFEAIRASTVAAKSKEDGVRNAFITTWGDDGNECDV
jgi:hypothetical protein